MKRMQNQYKKRLKNMIGRRNNDEPESLHNLQWLGDTIRGGDPTTIIQACDFHIKNFKEYIAGYTNFYKGNPAPVFQGLRKRMLDLNEAIMAFEKIKEKAIAYDFKQYLKIDPELNFHPD